MIEIQFLMIPQCNNLINEEINIVDREEIDLSKIPIDLISITSNDNDDDTIIPNEFDDIPNRLNYQFMNNNNKSRTIYNKDKMIPNCPLKSFQLENDYEHINIQNLYHQYLHITTKYNGWKFCF